MQHIHGCDAVVALDPLDKPCYRISLPEWRMPKPPQPSDLVAAARYVARGADLSLHIHFQHPISSTNGSARPPLLRPSPWRQPVWPGMLLFSTTEGSTLLSEELKVSIKAIPPSSFPTHITHAIGTQEDTNLTRFHFLKLQENTLNWWALPTWEGPLLCALTPPPPPTLPPPPPYAPPLTFLWPVSPPCHITS